MFTRSRAPVVTKNWLQGDLKPEPQNQLELKVNASIQWITTVNASIEFKRYIYITPPQNAMRMSTKLNIRSAFYFRSSI